MAKAKIKDRYSSDNSIVPEGRYKGYKKSEVPEWYKRWIFNDCKGTLLHYWFYNTKPSKQLDKYFNQLYQENHKKNINKM